jgi:pimeloyl-ACP methyl ester carboxylesterase
MPIEPITVNGVTLSVLVDGPAGTEAPPVLLVHGWPDDHELWRHQIAALVAAGRRVIAPDLRGFGASDKPDGVEAYSLVHHFGDLLGLLDELGAPRVALVGHDWGAAIAWGMAALAPDRVERLCAISVGHPTSFAAAGWEQRRRSWYFWLFCHSMAEEVLPRDEWAALHMWGSNPDAGRHRALLERPGALTASLGIYRANVSPEQLFLGEPLALPAVACRTLGIWSDGDGALTEVQMAGSAEQVAGPWHYERIAGCGHFIPSEAPGQLTPLLLDFLAG